MRKFRIAALAAMLVVGLTQTGCTALFGLAATALSVAAFVDESKPQEPPSQPQIDDAAVKPAG